MPYDSEQRKVARRIVRVGRKRGESPMEIKAALETGIVESGLRNLTYGDADSQGWRQERASLYKDPTNLDASINRFFDETSSARAKKRYTRAGDLAADVQRPAAQYRGRYQEVSGEADRLRGKGGGRVAPDGGGGSEVESRTRTERTFDEAGYGDAIKKQQLAEFLSRRRGRQSVLLRTGAVSTAPVDPASYEGSRQVTERVKVRPKAGGSRSDGGRAPGGLVPSVQTVDRWASGLGVPVTAKQEPGHAAGGDHDPAVKDASARDYGGSEASRRRLFRKIARTLGQPNATYKGADLNVTVDGVRWQVISRDHGSGPHLHVGWRRTG